MHHWRKNCTELWQTINSFSIVVKAQAHTRKLTVESLRGLGNNAFFNVALYDNQLTQTHNKKLIHCSTFSTDMIVAILLHSVLYNKSSKIKWSRQSNETTCQCFSSIKVSDIPIITTFDANERCTVSLFNCDTLYFWTQNKWNIKHSNVWVWSYSIVLMSYKY